VPFGYAIAHAGRAADEPAEPHEPAAREQVAEQVVRDLVPVLSEVVEPRAHEPTDEPREDHLVGPIARLADLLEPPREHEPAQEEGEPEADPERLQGERADV
jgi:hypothetical protein